MLICNISLIHANFNETFREHFKIKDTDKNTNITVINVLPN